MQQSLDESQPLAGLLRKCLLLGAETGSDALRQWARYELNGYGDDIDVPAYRTLQTPPISVDSQSGPTWIRGQVLHRLQLPARAREAVAETFTLRQPVEELESLAKTETLSFTTGGLAYAQSIWNGELGPYQQIVGMSFKMSGSVVASVLGQVRTQLIDIVADLLADAPLTQLPGKEKVDAAVGHHIGTQYNTTIQTVRGAAAIGTKAQAAVKGLSVEDALGLLDAVRSEIEVLVQGDSVELLEAVEALQAEVARGSEADTGEVIKKAGRLRRLAESVGVPVLTAAASGAVDAITNLAMSGVFG